MYFASRRALAARLSTLAGAISLILGTATVHADDVSDLKKRLDEQDQKIKVLERKLEISDEAAAAAVPSTPVVKASPKGFSIGSPDGANVFKLRALLHFDGRHFLDDATPDTAS